MNSNPKDKSSKNKSALSSWRLRIHEIIFEADTRMGKAFDIILIITILLSVIAVMLDSMPEVRRNYGSILLVLEWSFTILFTIEYVLRLITVGRPLKYAGSFYGIVDLLSIIPTYFSLLFPGTQMLVVIRILRVLRIFRVLKLAQYLGEAQMIKQALKASRRKITVFLVTVVTIVIIVGSMMYLIEGEESGFVSIPHSIYWAIVTLTTVGYGDITPITSLGRILSAIVMILGYAIIAVPTGIVTAEMTQTLTKKHVTTQACPQCSMEGHDVDAQFCKYCGSVLNHDSF
ncbi:MAG: ion transporter [Calditrichaeota bacterium]|nr:ion transporter [Calditrichota bacterium]